MWIYIYMYFSACATCNLVAHVLIKNTFRSHSLPDTMSTLSTTSTLAPWPSGTRKRRHSPWKTKGSLSSSTPSQRWSGILDRRIARDGRKSAFAYEHNISISDMSFSIKVRYTKSFGCIQNWKRVVTLQYGLCLYNHSRISVCLWAEGVSFLMWVPGGWWWWKLDRLILGFQWFISLTL